MLKRMNYFLEGKKKVQKLTGIEPSNTDHSAISRTKTTLATIIKHTCNEKIMPFPFQIVDSVNSVRYIQLEAVTFIDQQLTTKDSERNSSTR